MHLPYIQPSPPFVLMDYQVAFEFDFERALTLFVFSPVMILAPLVAPVVACDVALYCDVAPAGVDREITNLHEIDCQFSALCFSLVLFANEVRRVAALHVYSVWLRAWRACTEFIHECWH